jgi:hypothetical protein
MKGAMSASAHSLRQGQRRFRDERWKVRATLLAEQRQLGGRWSDTATETARRDGRCLKPSRRTGFGFRPASLPRHRQEPAACRQTSGRSRVAAKRSSSR